MAPGGAPVITKAMTGMCSDSVDSLYIVLLACTPYITTAILWKNARLPRFVEIGEVVEFQACVFFHRLAIVMYGVHGNKTINTAVHGIR